jgi:ankyrin repeat protein
VMKLLLGRGENVNATNIHGDSPLILAVQGDHREAVILLLDAGADVNLIPYNGEAALLHVQSAAIAQRLLEHGANVNSGGSTFNRYGTNNRTPLMSASFYKDKELIPLLLDWGAEVNARDGYGQTALICAASHSPGSQVQILLEAGAGDNLQEDLDTALFSAVSVRTDCVEDLQFYHSGLIPPGTPNDPMLVCKAVEEELRKTIELLLNHGADIAARDHVRATALHMACRNVILECIQTLLQHHPDVNARDLNGKTPLDYVRSNSKRPHAAPFRVTPFQVQYRINQRRQIVPLLRQAGAKTSKELLLQSTTM